MGSISKIEHGLQRSCPSCGSLSRTRVVDDRFEMAARLDGFNQPGSDDFNWLRSKWADEGQSAPRFPYAKCAECGLIHAEIYPDDAALAQLYAGLSDNMDMVEETARRRTQSDYARALDMPFPSGGGYLEIGPDTGLFLQEARKVSNFNLDAFDKFSFLEPNISAHAALHGLDLPKKAEVHDGLSLAQVEGPFSLAVLVHVLDHLRRPQDLLSEIASKMMVGGQILIVTHNQASTIARVMGRFWPGYHAQHPQLYSKETLADALKRAGFAGIQLKDTRNVMNLNGIVSMGARTLGVGHRTLGRVGQLEIGLRLGNMLAVARIG